MLRVQNKMTLFLSGPLYALMAYGACSLLIDTEFADERSVAEKIFLSVVVGVVIAITELKKVSQRTICDPNNTDGI